MEAFLGAYRRHKDGIDLDKELVYSSAQLVWRKASRRKADPKRSSEEKSEASKAGLGESLEEGLGVERSAALEGALASLAESMRSIFRIGR